MKVVLHVAEKPTVAKTIAQILSGGTASKDAGDSKFNPNFSFKLQFPGVGDAAHVVTSVTGHLMEIDFVQPYRGWRACEPIDLFTCPVEKTVPKDKRGIERNLKRLAKQSAHLVLWLDCDREGENIAYEVVGVCLGSKKTLKVHRAVFSSLVAAEVKKAYRTLKEPDQRLSAAVDVRQELDLRIGSAFTRFQTFFLQQRHPSLAGVISYGPCQFPTLGFVVDRYYQVVHFVKEAFWTIKCTVAKDEAAVAFHWDRTRLFDRLACVVLYERSLRAVADARVTRVQTKPAQNTRPLPLTTVELQKASSKFFRIDPTTTMKIAEELYTKGFVSYPRTETNIYPSGMGHEALVRELAGSRTYGEYCQRLLAGGRYEARRGNASDNSHPPIHPTKLADGLGGAEGRIYDLIVRTYLASVSENARGFETTVGLAVGEETFHATGLRIAERNFLDIYPFRKWGEKEVPAFEEGEHVRVTEYAVESGETTPPKPLTEAELIALMDKNGIGTDATVAQHIEKIKERQYVTETKGALVPTNLGLALIEGYDSMGFEFSRPSLRAAM